MRRYHRIFFGIIGVANACHSTSSIVYQHCAATGCGPFGTSKMGEGLSMFTTPESMFAASKWDQREHLSHEMTIFVIFMLVQMFSFDRESLLASDHSRFQRSPRQDIVTNVKKCRNRVWWRWLQVMWRRCGNLSWCVAGVRLRIRQTDLFKDSCRRKWI